MRETLSFEELTRWFRGNLSHSVSAQVTTAGETVAFLEGRIESVMGFESTDSRGILIEGGAGAWTLQLDETQFKSATLSLIPGSSSLTHLMIKIRNYWVVIDPGIEAGRRPRPRQ